MRTRTNETREARIRTSYNETPAETAARHRPWYGTAAWSRARRAAAAAK